MSTIHPDDEPPFMQRLYDNVWLLALLALLFFAVSYVGWGLLDIYTVPAR
ncbi:hypothetical protein [Halovivax gelatinilyticus]|nr:hypothetical protein [Halovivax gelatinilyticus]